MYDQEIIGFKDGLAVWVSRTLIEQRGIDAILDDLGLTRRYPVKTDLSGNVVMVKGDSHEDAVSRYLSGISPQKLGDRRRDACSANRYHRTDAPGV